jgi:hypothetical protein
MSDDNVDTEGYILASDYALEELVGIEYVTHQLKQKNLDGRLINNIWYVKKGAKIGEATTKVRAVQVTGISIPFGDVLMVSFQFAVAGIILAIPLAFLIIAISNS